MGSAPQLPPADAAVLQAPSAWNAFRFREAASRFTSGVAVIGCEGGEGPIVTLADQVMVISMSPPRLLVCLPKSDPAHEVVLRAQRISIGLLAEHDRSEAQKLASARSGELGAPFWRVQAGEPPQYLAALASFAGEVTQRLDAGSSSVLIAAVTVQAINEGRPLVRYRGELNRLSATGEGPH